MFANFKAEKLLKNLKRNGFTLAELIITIFIIAVLCSATVVSYIALKKRAEKSNGTAIVAQFNRALTYDFSNHPTLSEAVEAVEELGADFKEESDKLNGFYIAYRANEEKFILCDESEDIKEGESGSSVWVAVKNETEISEYGKIYSVYIAEEFTAESVTINYGYDAGDTGGVIGTVKIENEAETGEILCRAGGNEKFIFNAPNATIIYYGEREAITDCNAAKITYITDTDDDSSNNSGDNSGDNSGNSSDNTSGGNETVTAYDGPFIRCDESGNADENGGYALFGRYPQSDVTKEKGEALSETYALKTTLPKNGEENNSSGWISYCYYSGTDIANYMWYKDVDTDGDKLYDYRAVYFTQYRANKISSDSTTYRQKDNGYTVETVYWFEYEPLLWKIISDDGGEYELLCEKIIGSGQFNADGSTDYAGSDLSKALNGEFLNGAFSSAQQEQISDTVIDGATYKIFALTLEAVKQLSAENLTKSPTDYAKAQGLCGKDSSRLWWINGAHDGTHCYCVSYQGSYDGVYSSPLKTDVGYVPALKLKIS